MENDLMYQGTKFKAYVNLEPIGSLSMKDYSFEIDVYTDMSAKKLVYTKEQCIALDDNTYFAVVDSSQLGLGYLKLRVRAKIPDNQVDGFRDEVIVFSLGKRLVKGE
jgi:hypothetical protein